MKLRTITVRELIETLQDEDPDARVIVSTDYGDRGHTQQALPLRGECDTVTIERSAYSTSGFAVSDDDEGSADPHDEYEPYLLLR